MNTYKPSKEWNDQILQNLLNNDDFMTQDAYRSIFGDKARRKMIHELIVSAEELEYTSC